MKKSPSTIGGRYAAMTDAELVAVLGGRNAPFECKKCAKLEADRRGLLVGEAS